MVDPESSFVQTWQGPHPQCYIPSPKDIGLLVPEKMFKGVLPYMGVATILVMWPYAFKNISFLKLRGLYMKFDINQPSGFWENMFRYVCVDKI